MQSPQLVYALDIMARYMAYAKSIGCKVWDDGPMSDIIECNVEQEKLLSEWWARETRRAA